ncbi:MAG TPA: RNA polymerase sigma factor [Acholeplasmataceae bacterium]|nr:RNA polymerase sigma factor [Acholeplasmataceae bacterium]HQC30793.1 RNA polymerase sigma factor [Acholeplasmataceae bacterium]
MQDDILKLIEKLKNKDNEAFEIIYYQTHKMVFSIIYSIVKDDLDAEDLMQDTYIKMIENINSFKVGRNFKTWLGTIARNLAIDHYRRSQRVLNIDLQEEEQVYLESTNENLDLKAEALELLETLSSDEQLIVLLRVVDELTFREISEITNRPLGTVIWSYNQSINKLSKLYKEVLK